MSAARVKLRSAGLCVDLSARGAELRSFRPDGTREWLWQGDPAWWDGQAPLLFPVIGRSPGGIARWQGRSFEMPPHGVARQRDFRVLAAADDRAVFELTDDAITRPHYPFAFRLTVDYLLAPDALTMTVTARNPARDDVLPIRSPRPERPLVDARGRIGGPRGSPRPRATGRGACRRRRTASAPRSCSRRRWPGRCRAGRVRRRPARASPACAAREAHRQQHEIGLELERAAGDFLHRHAAVGALHPFDAHAFQRLDRPFEPTARLVSTAKSRAQPSSCEEEVRSFSGQSGQVSALFSFSGGFGMISSWVTTRALAVRGADAVEPVSPPPMTTTCLPFALISVPRGAARDPRRRRRACSAA
jgi:hypothetical protein